MRIRPPPTLGWLALLAVLVASCLPEPATPADDPTAAQLRELFATLDGLAG